MIGYCLKCGEYRGDPSSNYGMKKLGELMICEKCGSVVIMI